MPTKVSFKFHFMPPPLNRALGGKSIGRLEWDKRLCRAVVQSGVFRNQQ